MRLNVIILLLLTCTLAFSQNLPTFKVNENRSFYLGMENEIALSLNNADPIFIKLKCNETRIRKSSDSLYHLTPSAVFGDEIKIKLYYKNLPVDIITLPVVESPVVKIQYESDINKPITIDNFFNLKLNVDFEDEYLRTKGWRLFSFNTEVKRGDFPPTQFIIIRNNTLNPLRQYKDRLKSGDKILVNDVIYVNNRNQRVNCQSNYFEIPIE